MSYLILVGLVFVVFGIDAIHDELVLIRKALTEPVTTLNYGVPVESLGRES